MTARTCFFLMELMRNEDGEYFLCEITEGELSYEITDFPLGNSFAVATEWTAEQNIQKGLTEEDVIEIVYSPMRAQVVVK